MTSTKVLDYLTSLVADDDAIPLTETALAIAQDAYPDLDLQAELAALDVLALRLKRRIAEGTPAIQRLRLLNHFFYRDLGFANPWSSEKLSYFHHGDHCAFLLQNYYVKELAENLMLHLLVEDADAWWQRLREIDIAGRHGVQLGEPEDRAWRMRDFTLHDPSGVLWRIGHNLD